ncbi:UNVERIFIED_CONTAM: Transposon Tf2-12 polyprotein [Sesamum radiatum]|uniref:Transposon Tf2-12 polyprotein n=1 Tax=Sesamum radiatum TaxID=300843 RepID=A0AAW2P0W2_SESRA
MPLQAMKLYPSWMDRLDTTKYVWQPADEELTAFRTPKGIYCYKVMPFGLKNAGATYQRAMQKIFDDMLHKNVECYVDDLVVKSKKRENHFHDYLEKFLGSIVRQWGIDIEQAKIDAILRMPEPRNIHELKSLQGKLAYLWRAPFNSLLAAQERSVGILLAQKNDEGKENALYYLSRTMTPNELKYSPIEKLCLALIFSIQKLKHYFQSHSIHLVSKANPSKYVMAKPVLSDRLARWYLQLQQFEIKYVPQKAVKGKVLADFLADHPMPAEWELSDELPDEDVLVIEVTPPWKMYFDGALHKEGADAGVVFVTSEGEVLSYSFTLTQNCSNNVAKYQALILGLEIAVDAKQLPLKVYGDSQLVVNQLLGLYEVKKPELLPYHNYAKRLMGWLGDVELEHLPRKDNKQADALAKLASTLSLTDKEARIPICKSWVIPPIFSDDEDDMLQEEENHVTKVFEVEEEDWRQPLVDYLKYGKLPNDLRRRTDTYRRATRFIYYKGAFYRRSFDGLFLRCLSDNEKVQTMEEAHSWVCGAHQSGPKLHFNIKRMDVVGPLIKSSGGHLYILAATDYFSKWADAVPLKEVKKENVANFIRTHIIYRYGVPRYIITDNGKPFRNSLIDKLCQHFDFKQRNSSMYYAAANGLAEAFNKTLCNLLKKVVAKSKRDWHERIGEALWAYRTTVRTPTQATPYALVYGVEAVIPLEQQIPSLRIAIQEGLTEEENAQIRLEELEALDEKRLEEQQRLECYQARLFRAFNKKVRLSSFKVGDLVLAVRRPIITTHRTGNKFLPKWDGPYVVKEAYTNGAYKLVAEDGLRIDPINGKFLKRYYA